MNSARFVGGWGLGIQPPSGASQPLPQVCIDPPPEKIVEINQKYIADSLWFSHKSSTAYEVDITLSDTAFALRVPFLDRATFINYTLILNFVSTTN